MVGAVGASVRGLQRLKELFPDWTEEELFVALSECKFDVQQTVNGITDGLLERWSRVDTKKGRRAEKPAGGAAAPASGSSAGATSASASGSARRGGTRRTLCLPGRGRENAVS